MNYEPPQRGFKTFIFLFLLGSATFLGLRYSQVAQNYFSSANINEEEVRPTLLNITDSSVIVMWESKKFYTGSIRIESENGHSKEYVEISPSKLHTLHIFDLAPSENYTIYLYNKTLNFKTAAVEESSFYQVTGQIKTKYNINLKNALVILTIRDKDRNGTMGSSLPLAVSVDSYGIYSLNLKNAKNFNASEPFSFSHTFDEVLIEVITEDLLHNSFLLNVSQLESAPPLEIDYVDTTKDLRNVKTNSSNIDLSQKL